MRHLYLVREEDDNVARQQKLADDLVKATQDLARKRDAAETKEERDAYQKALMITGSAALRAACPDTFGA